MVDFCIFCVDADEDTDTNVVPVGMVGLLLVLGGTPVGMTTGAAEVVGTVSVVPVAMDDVVAASSSS